MIGTHAGKLTPAQRRTVVELYRLGWNTQRIAEHFNVTRENVWKLLRRRGVQMRPRWPKSGPHGAGLPDSMPRAERDRQGVIVTLREQSSMRVYAMHVPGLRGAALEQVAAWCDAQPLDWRLLCYSTPLTIRRDLDGSRTQRNGQPREVDALGNVEATALARIGRSDLLDPELVW